MEKYIRTGKRSQLRKTLKQKETIFSALFTKLRLLLDPYADDIVEIDFAAADAIIKEMIAIKAEILQIRQKLEQL